MKTSKKIMAWLHWDLDGVVCYQLLRWTFGKIAQIEYLPTTVNNFREQFVKWLSTNNMEDYDQIFIMDLGVSNHKDLFDEPNVFIIDHHEGHTNDTYKKANSMIMDYSSASKLAFEVFKKLYGLKLSKQKRLLVELADDFDSYKLTVPQSSQLNVVFWDSNDKFESFTKHFGSGFNGFTLQQQNIIKLHDLKLSEIKNNLTVYSGDVKIQGKYRRVCSTFAKQYINEVADILLNDYNAEIAIIINPNTDHVSFRRAKDQDVDLDKLAKILTDGGGHEFSSGGQVTEDFILFTKLLNEI